MSNHDNLLGLFGTMYRWRKTIRNVCIAALIGGVAFALWLPNYYKSTTIFYPASLEVSKPELVFGSSSKMIEYFGTDKDMDRLMEISYSNEVIDYLINRFGLYKHYSIDSSGHEGLYWVRETFRGHYSVQKNKNEAIELSIEDQDPKMASDMANAARDKINEIAQRLVKNTQETLLKSFEENIKQKQLSLNILADSLRHLQAKYGIYSIGEQGDRLTDELATAQTQVLRNQARLEVLSNNPLIPQDTVEYIKANLKAYESILDKLKSPRKNNDDFSAANFNEGLPLVAVVTDLHYQARRQLSYDIERYNQIKSTFNTNIPAIQLVESAETPIMKSRPRRAVIVIACVVTACLFSLLAALIADAYRDVNWKKIKS